MIKSSKNPYKFYNGKSVISFSNNSNRGFVIENADGHDNADMDYVFDKPNQTKYLVPLYYSPYHLLFDTIGIILSTHERYSDAMFIIVSSTENENKRNRSPVLVDLLFEILEEKKIQYELITINSKRALLTDAVVIDIDGYGFDRIRSVSQIPKIFNIEKPKKTTKIYLSRSKTVSDLHWKRPDLAKGLLFSDDIRMYEEYRLEEYFKNNGYEIVYAEDFANGIDQVKLFNSAKIIVGVTGGGLSNMAFMDKGTTIVELSVPIAMPKDNELNWEYSLHHLYKDIAFCNEMLYLSIPSMRDADSVINFIENDRLLKDIVINDN
jgi:hypothetical protein